MKDVTILIPSYNEAKSIEKAIRSAVPQAEFVIVSDNCSTDGTQEICKRLAKKFSNLVFYEQSKNLGGVKNAEFLYKQVQTDYVMNMGAHDILAENYVYELKKCLDENLDSVMAYAPAISIDDDDKILSETMLDDFATGFSSDNVLERVYTATVMEYNYAFFGLFRSDIFLKNMDFTKKAGVDHLIMAKCAQDGKFVRCLDTRFYLRVPTREESPDKYMERLAGTDEVSSFDMSYMCVGLLNIISDSKYACEDKQEILCTQARKYLQKKYAFYCSDYIKSRLDQLSKANELMILYGAGLDADRILPVLKKNILFIVDKDPKKHGTYKSGILVQSLEKLNEYKENKIIIGLIGRFELISLSLRSEYSIDVDRLISLDVDAF